MKNISTYKEGGPYIVVVVIVAVKKMPISFNFMKESAFKKGFIRENDLLVVYDIVRYNCKKVENV